MAHMPSNKESTRREFGYSLQLTNSILDSGATCHITPDILGLIPGSLVETDKYIEVADGHFVTAKQTGEVQIKCMTIMGKASLLRYIMYYWHQTCAINYLHYYINEFRT